MNESLREEMERAARCFRLGMVAAGSESLVTVIDGLSSMFADPPTGSGGPQLGAIAALLGATLDAQGRGDFLFVADLLEYEMPVYLRAQCQAGQLASV